METKEKKFTNKSKTEEKAVIMPEKTDGKYIDVEFSKDQLKQLLVESGMESRRKKFDGDVDSGYAEMRQVNTSPRKHRIQHCEVIYRKHNAVKGVLLVNPPMDYIYRKQVLSLHGIVKAYALRHGLKIYTGGEEMIAETYR